MYKSPEKKIKKVHNQYYPYSYNLLSVFGTKKDWIPLNYEHISMSFSYVIRKSFDGLSLTKSLQ